MRTWNETCCQLVLPAFWLEGEDAFSGRKEDSGNSSKDDTLGTEFAHQQIISDHVMWKLNFYLNVLLCGSLAIFGTFNNIVNMIIFNKLGLKDSMNVYLFGLALTDFSLSLVIVVARTFSIWDLFFDHTEVDPVAILYLGFAWIADSLFLCSGWITTCLSLERCICVLFPFKVKRIFTKNRSIACVVVIHVITGATNIPIFLTQRLDWARVHILINNVTTFGRRLVVAFSENQREVENYVEIFNATVVPIPSLILILGSVSGMVYGLTVSSSKRKSMTAASGERDGEKQESSLTHKTRRLAKVVVMLAFIFTVCSIPRTYASYVSITDPEINEDGDQRNFNTFLWLFADLFSALNASVNFFVYLKINSAYRVTFGKLFFPSS